MRSQHDQGLRFGVHLVYCYCTETCHLHDIHHLQVTYIHAHLCSCTMYGVLEELFPARTETLYSACIQCLTQSAHSQGRAQFSSRDAATELLHHHPLRQPGRSRQLRCRCWAAQSFIKHSSCRARVFLTGPPRRTGLAVHDSPQLATCHRFQQCRGSCSHWACVAVEAVFCGDARP